MSLLDVTGLSYRHASRKNPAIQGVDLRIDPGEIILLTGDSGAGKSTLLQAIAGLYTDEDEGDLSGEIRTEARIGMVLQDPDSQVISARVGDDVAFGAENMGYPREEIWQRVETALDLVGLDLPLDHPTSRLSGGQKQRLALAGVIAMGAGLVLLDEPTANLDPQGREELVAAIARVQKETGAGVIIAEHRGFHWLKLSPTIYHLSRNGLERRDQLPDPPEVAHARTIPSAVSAMCWAENLTTAFGPPRTLSVPEGFSTVMTGTNGSGKSTLAATLGGLIEPKQGEVFYSDSLRNGISGPSHKWRSSQLARRIGYVFQDPEHHFAFKTVRDELAATGASQRDVDTLLEDLRLAHLTEANPFTLSGGEKRRLSVATAIINAPQLVILDEPTFGQDDRGFLELLRLIRQLTDTGHSVLSITHDPLYLKALADKHVVIE